MFHVWCIFLVGRIKNGIRLIVPMENFQHIEFTGCDSSLFTTVHRYQCQMLIGIICLWLILWCDVNKLRAIFIECWHFEEIYPSRCAGQIQNLHKRINKSAACQNCDQIVIKFQNSLVDMIVLCMPRQLHDSAHDSSMWTTMFHYLPMQPPTQCAAAHAISQGPEFEPF